MKLNINFLLCMFLSITISKVYPSEHNEADTFLWDDESSLPSSSNNQKSDQEIYEEFWNCIRLRNIAGIDSIFGQHPQMVNQLINSQNKNGFTPLHSAVMDENLKMAKFLLGNGADTSINTANKDGFTPLHTAVKDGNLKLVELLLGLDNPNPNSNMSIADPNIANNAGFTPLHTAVMRGNTKMVILLLANGAAASINTPNNAGFTPLYTAVKNGNEEIVELLLKAGADPNFKSGTKYSPLEEATNNYRKHKDEKSRRILELLQNHINKSQVAKSSADSSGNEDMKLVQLLVDNGADTKIKDRYHDTPLILAGRNKDSENNRQIIELLERKSNPLASVSGSQAAQSSADYVTKKEFDGLIPQVSERIDSRLHNFFKLLKKEEQEDVYSHLFKKGMFNKANVSDLKSKYEADPIFIETLDNILKYHRIFLPKAKRLATN